MPQASHLTSLGPPSATRFQVLGMTRHLAPWPPRSLSASIFFLWEWFKSEHVDAQHLPLQYGGILLKGWVHPIRDAEEEEGRFLQHWHPACVHVTKAWTVRCSHLRLWLWSKWHKVREKRNVQITPHPRPGWSQQGRPPWDVLGSVVAHCTCGMVFAVLLR